MINRQHIVVGLLAALGPLGSPWHGGASAQDAAAFPSRTVALVVPYAAGTGADILSRVLGPRLSERWKAPVITDSR